MIIAQITDIHLGFEQANPDEVNRQRLDKTVQALATGTSLPDLLLATGDLTEHGDLRSYQALREAFADVPCPVWPCLGNHDQRDHFRAVFPEIPCADGFVQYALEFDGLRILVLDTLEEGRHGGAFCEIRAAWLSAQLALGADIPTIIVMHHPPVQVGIDWMDPGVDEPWIARFGAAIAGHDQIRTILCGHLHRPVVTSFAGRTLVVCPATAVQLGLDLRPIDPERPDGRPMITLDPSAHALHRWTNNQLVSHFVSLNDARVVVHYDETMQPLVRELTNERA